MGGTKPWLMVQDNRLYHPGGAILDALTGKVLTGEIIARGSKTVPNTRHLLLWAGKHVYGLRDDTLSVCRDDGTPAGQFTIPKPDLTADQKKVLAWTTGSEQSLDKAKQGAFSYSAAFTLDGERIFVRSFFHLIAVGR
jgi:hypothetical protein